MRDRANVRNKVSRQQVERFLVRQIADEAKDPAGNTSARFAITRQAVNAHLRRLAETGQVMASGSTRGRTYKLTSKKWSCHFPISPTLKEDVVWSTSVAPFLVDLPQVARAICYYGFTEILNNAVDHSVGKEVKVSLVTNPIQTDLMIHDDGVGIFRKIREALGLEDEGYAILELAKGKLTTDPARHTGEGLFFTTRAFDRFSIAAGKLFFHHEAEGGDWQVEDIKETKGTIVRMMLDNFTDRTMKELFDRFSAQDGTYRFSVTHVPVSLAQLGTENLISRSQGKRLVARFERFEKVMLDFSGVSEIGQAFADEVFRVFPLTHPATELSVSDASPDVLAMIQRARSGLAEQQGREPPGLVGLPAQQQR